MILITSPPLQGLGCLYCCHTAGAVQTIPPHHSPVVGSENTPLVPFPSIFRLVIYLLVWEKIQPICLFFSVAATTFHLTRRLRPPSLTNRLTFNVRPPIHHLLQQSALHYAEMRT